MPKQKRARGRPKKNWMEGIKAAMNERILNEGQWEDRKQWNLGVGQRRKTFWTRYIHTYKKTLTEIQFFSYCPKSLRFNKLVFFPPFSKSSCLTVESTKLIFNLYPDCFSEVKRTKHNNLSSQTRAEVKTSGGVILLLVCAFVAWTGETLPIKHSKINIHGCHMLKPLFMITVEWNGDQSSTSITKGKKFVELYFHYLVCLHNFHWKKIYFSFDTDRAFAVYWTVFFLLACDILIRRTLCFVPTNI